VLRRAGAEVVAWTLGDFDVTDAAATRRALAAARPDVVVHAAAYTAVDRAEAEPEVAMAVNRDGTANLCAACAEAGTRIVYLSTDYVFDGTARTPIRPDVAPAPLGAYGRSKAAGEVATREHSGPWLIVRAGWMFGPGRPTFVGTMRAAAAARRPVTVVSDLVGAPASTALVAEALWGLLERGARGVWHVAPRGAASWYDVAREVFAATGAPPGLVSPCAAAASDRAAARPRYSVLDASGTERLLGRPFPEWERDVRAYAATGRLPGLGLLAPEAA
jgi:dTDP-4-dehydrorhamnose reductase